jgi:hypothetical protein
MLNYRDLTTQSDSTRKIASISFLTRETKLLFNGDG